MKKIGYMLYHQDAIDIIDQSDCQISKGCSMVFMDPYNIEKEYPQFDLLLSQAKPNDELLVLDLSYLATTFKHLISIIDRLDEKSIDLICVNQTIDTKHQDFKTMKYFIKLFEDLYSEEIANKKRQTRKENSINGQPQNKSQGMRKKTLIKARKTYELKQEGRLTDKEIMELLNLKAATFYRLCKWGKDGLLSSDINNTKPKPHDHDKP